MQTSNRGSSTYTSDHFLNGKPRLEFAVVAPGEVVQIVCAFTSMLPTHLLMRGLLFEASYPAHKRFIAWTLRDAWSLQIENEKIDEPIDKNA